MFRGGNIQYDGAERTRGFAYGGLGAIQRLVHQVGLAEAIDQDLSLLKRHQLYHESDHVLKIAYSTLCGGQCLQDLERLRNDEVYLDVLGAIRIPDPTTAGDFCRRFREDDVITLRETINRLRVPLWQSQPSAFFEQAILDGDGVIAETIGACKEGMNIAYDGRWGYHVLVLSLANTGEPLYLVNRPGNWAHMVMVALAWTLKAWLALRLPAQGRWADRHAQEKETLLRMEFKQFRQTLVELPCQIVRTGRRIVYRLLAWNPWLPVFFRLWRVLHAGPG